MVQKTETIEHNEFITSEKNESVHSATNDSICQRDTIKGGAGECGRIDIERDTAGRPVVILWERYSNFTAESSTETLETGYFHLHASSNNNQAAVSMDSVSQKEEEIKEDVKVGIPLEAIIACGMAAILIIFYTGDWIIRLWKRRKTR